VSAVKRSLRDSVARLGLAGPALGSMSVLAPLDPRKVLSNARIRRQGAPDHLPIPPSNLVVAVAGTADLAWFLKGGELAAQSIRDVLYRHGVEMSQLAAVLDFGAGCGRVLRHWGDLRRARISGTDYNGALVEWCRENLPFAEVNVNQLTPPLAYDDGEFDLIYALSVFTHLTESLQVSWIAELTRVLEPGGHLIISPHGLSYASRLSPSELRRFQNCELVVKNDTKAPGTNACAAYHPLHYVVESLAADLELVEFAAQGARGNPHQDLYLFQKPISVA
jgi:SAM-dependent methyltransferase